MPSWFTRPWLAMVVASGSFGAGCFGSQFSLKRADRDSGLESTGGNAATGGGSSGGRPSREDGGVITNGGASGQGVIASGGRPSGEGGVQANSGGLSMIGAGGLHTNGTGGRANGGTTSTGGASSPGSCKPGVTCLSCCAALERSASPAIDAVFASRMYGCACVISACVGVCRCNTDYGSPSLDCVACMSAHITETACRDDWNACQQIPHASNSANAHSRASSPI